MNMAVRTTLPTRRGTPLPTVLFHNGLSGLVACYDFGDLDPDMRKTDVAGRLRPIITLLPPLNRLTSVNDLRHVVDVAMLPYRKRQSIHGVPPLAGAAIAISGQAYNEKRQATLTHVVAEACGSCAVLVLSDRPDGFTLEDMLLSPRQKGASQTRASEYELPHHAGIIVVGHHITISNVAETSNTSSAGMLILSPNVPSPILLEGV